MTTPYAAEKKAWAKRRTAIVKMVLKGFPKAEIGRKYGVSRQRVLSIYKDYQKKVQDGRISPL